MRRVAVLWVSVLFLSALAVTLVVTKRASIVSPPVEQTPCQALASPVQQLVDLSTGATTFRVQPTTGGTSAAASVEEGTYDRGFPFTAAWEAAPGLIPVQLLESVDGDRLYTIDPEEIRSARSSGGYIDRGPAFYVLASENEPCAAPIYRMTKQGRHQYAGSTNVQVDLRAEGWRDDGTAFHVATKGARAARPKSVSLDEPITRTGPGQFTFAVIPDTQQEVLDASDDRFADRTRWLVRNQAALRLRFVAHVGDVVNWDTDDHDQYIRAQRAMRVLEEADIPYAVAPGNHDGQATCVGGAACPGRDIPSALRDTEVLNRFFPRSSFPALGGTFKSGVLDNSFHQFGAEGKRFLVLTLEMGARPAVLDWARSVIVAHPRDNVIIVTHYYLTSTGRVAATTDYGDATPAAVREALVEPFPNVKLVLSGHVGTAAQQEEGREGGSRVVSMLQCFHDNETNPMRLITIDVRKGTLSSLIYSPATGVTYPQLNTAPVEVDWV